MCTTVLKFYFTSSVVTDYSYCTQICFHFITDTAIFNLPVVVMCSVKPPADGVQSYLFKHPILWILILATSCLSTFCISLKLKLIIIAIRLLIKLANNKMKLLSFIEFNRQIFSLIFFNQVFLQCSCQKYSFWHIMFTCVQYHIMESQVCQN